MASWLRHGALARVLWPLSKIYGTLWALRVWVHRRGWTDRYRAPVPVIVVGNVVVGGAGKTPTVLAVLQHLQARGWHPGVVSRGHGRSSRGVLPVTPQTPASQSGDEPALLARLGGAPVFVGEHRANAAQALLAAHPETDVLVCDDGLQHLGLLRDLEIVVFDDRGVGNGWLLPAGLLRQPWPAPPGNPTVPRWVLVHGQPSDPTVDAQTQALAGALPGWSCARTLAPEAVNRQGARRSLADFQTRPLAALAGIGRPERFFDMLAQQGLRLQHRWALPDHAPTPRDWPAGARDWTWLCTEKDAVKLWAAGGADPSAPADTPPDLWAVPLRVQPAAGFFQALDAQLSSWHGHQTD